MRPRPDGAENVTAGTRSSFRYRALLGLGGFAAATALVAAGGLSANAAESGDSTVANVQVSGAIALTGLTPSFTLVGLPGATAASVGAVNFTVTTNNLAGYAVTVQAAAPTLAATNPGNTDSIPIGALGVRETGQSLYTALSDTSPVTVRNQPTRSAEAGDVISNDYSVTVPFVNEDTYTVTLDYIATTL